MLRLKTLSVALFSILLAACSTMPTPTAYNHDKSLALNLAEAGGISDLQDQVVSAEQYEKIHSSGANVVAGVGWAVANYATPAPGFSSGWGLGLGMLSMIHSTDAPAKRRQLVAWMPREMAADPVAAQAKLREILAEALEQTFVELNWQYEGLEFSRRESSVIVASFFHPLNSGCPAESAAMTEKCVAGIYIQKPQEALATPEFIGTPGPAFFFKADSIYNGYASLGTKGHDDVDVSLFYRTLSKHMPAWAYFYVPPKSAMKANQDGHPEYSQVYFRGKQELFVRTE